MSVLTHTGGLPRSVACLGQCASHARTMAASIVMELLTRLKTDATRARVNQAHLSALVERASTVRPLVWRGTDNTSQETLPSAST